MTTRRKAMSSWLNFCEQSPRPKTYHEHRELLLLLHPLCISLGLLHQSALDLAGTQNEHGAKDQLMVPPLEPLGESGDLARLLRPPLQPYCQCLMNRPEATREDETRSGKNRGHRRRKPL